MFDEAMALDMVEVVQFSVKAVWRRRVKLSKDARWVFQGARPWKPGMDVEPYVERDPPGIRRDVEKVMRTVTDAVLRDLESTCVSMSSRGRDFENTLCPDTVDIAHLLLELVGSPERRRHERIREAGKRRGIRIENSGVQVFGEGTDDEWAVDQRKTWNDASAREWDELSGPPGCSVWTRIASRHRNLIYVGKVFVSDFVMRSIEALPEVVAGEFTAEEHLAWSVMVCFEHGFDSATSSRPISLLLGDSP